MASATKIEAKIIIAESYTLELSKEEAETLRAVMNAVGGDPKASRRRYTNAIDRALREAGVDHTLYGAHKDKTGSIWFNNEAK